MAPQRNGKRRILPTAVLIDNHIYIWGGIVNGEVKPSPLLEFDVKTHRWAEPKTGGDPPPPYTRHAACALEKLMYIYTSGHNPDWTCHSGIYKLDTSRIPMEWTKSELKTDFIKDHSATAIGSKIYFFGGSTGDEDCLCKSPEHWPGGFRYFNDVKVFDPEEDSVKNVDVPQDNCKPEGRELHSAFAHNGELYVFGGETNESSTTSTKQFNDLWSFNPQTSCWTKHEVQAPPPREGRICCMLGERMIFVGGVKEAEEKPRQDDGDYLFIFHPEDDARYADDAVQITEITEAKSVNTAGVGVHL